MAEVVTGLLYLTGLLFVASTFTGVVFDRMAPGRPRDAVLGTLFGATAGAAILASMTLPGGVVVDARMPLLVIAGLIGGPIGALAALPIPIGMRLEAGGTWVIGVLSIMAGPLVGLAVRAVRARLGLPLDRTAVLWAAAATPLLMISAVFVPMPLPAMVTTFLVPLVIFNAIGTLCVGFTVISELIRSETRHSANEREAFDARANLVPSSVFKSQLIHQWKLHEFFNTPHAYMLISIDDACTLKRAMGAKAFGALRMDVARVVSSHIRDADLATAKDFDRFAVLLPQSSVQISRSVATRIQERVRASIPGPHGPVTVSIGLADVSESMCAGDVEAIAEGALFLANARKPANAIGPDYSETLAPGDAPAEIAHRPWRGEGVAKAAETMPSELSDPEHLVPAAHLGADEPVRAASSA